MRGKLKSTGQMQEWADISILNFQAVVSPNVLQPFTSSLRIAFRSCSCSSSKHMLQIECSRCQSEGCVILNLQKQVSRHTNPGSHRPGPSRQKVKPWSGKCLTAQMFPARCRRLSLHSGGARTELLSFARRMGVGKCRSWVALRGRQLLYVTACGVEKPLLTNGS